MPYYLLCYSSHSGVQSGWSWSEEQGLGLHKLHLQTLRRPDGSRCHPVLHEVGEKMNTTTRVLVQLLHESWRSCLESWKNCLCGVTQLFANKKGTTFPLLLSTGMFRFTSRNCCNHSAAVRSNASEGTSLLPAHNDTELGIICPLVFSTSGCRWFSSLLIAPLMFPVCKMSTLLLDLPSALVFPNQHIPLLEIIFLNISTWRWHQIVTWHEIDAFQGFPSYVSFFWACLKCCWLLKIKPKTELNVWSLHFFTSTNSVVLV